MALIDGRVLIKHLKEASDKYRTLAQNEANPFTHTYYSAIEVALGEVVMSLIKSETESMQNSSNPIH